MTQIQIKRGLEANRSSVTPAAGELLYTTDDKKVYVGDGSTAGGNVVGAGGIPDWEVISSVTPTSGTASVEFTSIPNTYTDLMLNLENLQHTGGASTDRLRMALSADNGTTLGVANLYGTAVNGTYRFQSNIHFLSYSKTNSFPMIGGTQAATGTADSGIDWLPSSSTFGLIYAVRGYGANVTYDDTLDYIRIFFNSYNINAGTFTLYGR